MLIEKNTLLIIFIIEILIAGASYFGMKSASNKKIKTFLAVIFFIISLLALFTIGILRIFF